MYKELTDEEIRVITGVSNKVPFTKLGKGARETFEYATMKLRWGAGDYRELLLEGECDYLREWFISHPIMTVALIDRYQKACSAAKKLYWDIRCGRDA
jgi:hypothetical protein